MFRYNHYVPILKGKAGEFDALAHLYSKTRPHLTPLIDVPRILLDKEGVPTKVLDKHLLHVARRIKNCWGNIKPIFIDIADIKLTDRTVEGDHPLSCIFKHLRRASIQAIPVTGTDRDDAYYKTTKEIIQKDTRGVCVRVLNDGEMDDVPDLNKRLDELLQSLNISRNDSHLLLDFKDIRNNDIEKIKRKVIRIINELSGISDWRTLIVAASCYPDSLPSSIVERDKSCMIERKELILWKSIISNSNKPKRIPSFGDYGVVNPVSLDTNLKTAKSNAKIRYTVVKDWLIVKGHNVKEDPKQYYELAKRLFISKEYVGPQFSWGDNFIAKCAERSVECGYLQRWVTVDTNHHLTFVSEEIANTVLP